VTEIDHFKLEMFLLVLSHIVLLNKHNGNFSFQAAVHRLLQRRWKR